MGEEDANLQRLFLDTCLNDHLTDIIDREAANSHPKIYGESPMVSQMNISEKHFDNLHPLHIRLNKLASLYPATNQTPVGIFTEFIRQANKADTSTLTAQELFVAMKTTRCRDGTHGVHQEPQVAEARL